jgi:hypothetical protein
MAPVESDADQPIADQQQSESGLVQRQITQSVRMFREERLASRATPIPNSGYGAIASCRADKPFGRTQTCVPPMRS